MSAMHAVLDQTVNDENWFHNDNFPAARVNGWSVLPLHYLRRSYPELGIGTFHAMEERLAPAPRVRLKLLGEVLPPEEIPESVADVPVAGEAGVASATAYAEPDGDLVALGSLVCLITMIFTLSTFVGLAQTLF